MPPDPLPTGVLLCAPDHFAVVDQKNPHMGGTVDPASARQQWEALADAFRQMGLAVEGIAPVAGLEDMVFAANQTFTGLDAAGERLCVLARMRHASRRREVPFFGDWFAQRGYRLVEAAAFFEGSGDALWQPGRRRILLGHGFRSEPEAAALLEREFGAEVILVPLIDSRYYHLDTALCFLDAESALIAWEAFDDATRSMLRREIPHLIPTTEHFACNAVAHKGRVVIERRAEETVRRLEEAGFRVLPVDTGEFLKSGGSAFCLKQWLW